MIESNAVTVALLATITSFIFVWLTCPKFIKILKNFQKKGQPIRLDGPESHLMYKSGIPSMGGILIVISVILSNIIWNDINKGPTLILIISMIAFSILGIVDDYKKISLNKSDGISAKLKIIIQFLLAMGTIFAIYKYDNSLKVIIPFCRNLELDLGGFKIILGVLAIVGASNAVNLTDGLDGLASGIVTLILSFFLIVSIFLIYSVIGVFQSEIVVIKQIAIFSGALIGALIGFLWYNCHPARIFMGDSGSLALGATLANISIMLRSELFLLIVGFILVVEALSVILQVGAFKIFQKRIFKMAPIHHHFEKLGYRETTIVTRFTIISILALVLAIYALL